MDIAQPDIEVTEYDPFADMTADEMQAVPLHVPPEAASNGPNVPRVQQRLVYFAGAGLLLLGVCGIALSMSVGRTSSGSQHITDLSGKPMAGLSVPEVLTHAANPAAITAEGIRRLQTNHVDDGFLLLEVAADRGDAGASAVLARLYDPVLFRPGGPIPKADARQAARYYRDAARAGTDVTAAREGLRRGLESRARSGDLDATLSLRDFWP